MDFPPVKDAVLSWRAGAFFNSIAQNFLCASPRSFSSNLCVLSFQYKWSSVGECSTKQASCMTWQGELATNLRGGATKAQGTGGDATTPLADGSVEGGNPPPCWGGGAPCHSFAGHRTLTTNNNKGRMPQKGQTQRDSPSQTHSRGIPWFYAVCLRSLAASCWSPRKPTSPKQLLCNVQMQMKFIKERSANLPAKLHVLHHRRHCDRKLPKFLQSFDDLVYKIRPLLQCHGHSWTLAMWALRFLPWPSTIRLFEARTYISPKQRALIDCGVIVITGEGSHELVLACGTVPRRLLSSSNTLLRQDWCRNTHVPRAFLGTSTAAMRFQPAGLQLSIPTIRNRRRITAFSIARCTIASFAAEIAEKSPTKS